MTGVVDSHFARRLRPIDVDLLLGFAGEGGHGHDAVVGALVAAPSSVLLRL